MSAAAAKVVTRCFRQVCSCKDYWKVNRCLPDTRKEYELCFKRSETQYSKTFKLKEVCYDAPELWKSPPLL